MRTGCRMLGVGFLLLTAAVHVCAEEGHKEKAAEEARQEVAVRHERVGVNEYRNFIKNWDNDAHPYLFALIQSPEQYDALFAPAAVMGDQRPFAPKPELFTQEYIVLVARVMVAPGNMEEVFAVERVTLKDGELDIHYRYEEPEDAARHEVKNFLALRIPKHGYKRVSFYENGDRVGTLDVAGGQWTVPEPSQDITF